MTGANTEGEVLAEYFWPPEGTAYVGMSKARTPFRRYAGKANCYLCPETAGVTEVLRRNCHQTPETRLT
jgi:hypothetical protein